MTLITKKSKYVESLEKMAMLLMKSVTLVKSYPMSLWSLVLSFISYKMMLVF